MQETPTQEEKKTLFNADCVDPKCERCSILRELRRKARGQRFTVRRGQPKIGRNAPCVCGSGKKYKACHLARVARRGAAE